jgi:hypothetical protein
VDAPPLPRRRVKRNGTECFARVRRVQTVRLTARMAALGQPRPDAQGNSSGETFRSLALAQQFNARDT